MSEPRYLGCYTQLMFLWSVVFGACYFQSRAATINDIQHVVIFMQENRSFDEYFGSLKGVRGFNDRNALIFQNGSNVFYQPQGGSYVLPFYTTNQCVNDVAHDWTSGHAAWNSGKWDQWVPAKGTTAMTHYTRMELAYYYALAEAYTICDAFFCSAAGSTNPNRLYSMTGMIDPNGQGGGPVIDNSEPGFTWTTYPERLQAAGITWKFYQQTDNFDDNALAWFVQYRNATPGNALYDRGMIFVSDIVAAFKSDVANNSLPKVSWIIAPTALSEHPIYSPASGALLTKQLLDALASNPAVFTNTAFILTYDENGGFFDHVQAPTPPLGTPGEFVGGLPIGLGIRVPTIIVSPWTRGGYVCSQVFDHTSVLRFLETWTGVPEPNISAWRRMVCGDLTSAFNFSSFDTNYPVLPAPIAVDCNSGTTPGVPAPQRVPTQEAGALLARPLPYQLNANSFADCAEGRFYITMTNAGTSAGHLAIYANAYRADGPWDYDVLPSGAVTDYFSVITYGAGRYDLTCYGPNGFQRRFAGNITNACNQIEVMSIIDPNAGGITLAMRNSTTAAVTFTVTANAYLAGGPWTYVAGSGTTVSNTSLVVSNSGGWYDLTATASSDASFLRRFAGHIETNPPASNMPLIITPPSGQTVDAGTSASLSVAAINGPLTYQWQFNGTNLPSTTASSYSILNAGPADAGSYRVLVSNPNGSILSSPAQLTVRTTPQILAPFVGEVVDAGSDFTWAPQTAGGRPLTHRWYRNGALMAVSLTNTLSLGNLQVSDGGNYQLIASNVFGSATSSIAVLKVYAGPLTSNLVVHLPFDNNFSDTSGRGNHATYATNGSGAVSTPVFVAGRIGQAFQYTTLSSGNRFEYATLGYPNDLRLGASNDFSVSMWVNYTNQGNDLPFISNKDWAASANQGWGIFTQPGGNFRVNVTGPNSNTDKFSITSTPAVRDGTWHNIVVSFLRAIPPQSAYVYSYTDGVLANKTLMSVAGTIDTYFLPFAYTSPRPTWQTNWAVNIGQDGTGVYYDLGSAYNIAGKIDDLGIWRRALTANEAKAIYQAGLIGKDLSSAVVPTRLNATFSAGAIQLVWIANPSLKLQTTTSLNPAVWTDVPGTLGAGQASVPVTNSTSFFRLTQ